MARISFGAQIGNRTKAHPEGDLQAAIWAHIKVRGTKNTIAYHVPNTIKRSRNHTGILKGQGMVPGVADLAFVLSNGCAAFMELKAPGGRQSPAQVEFQARCERIDVPYVVCSDLDNALSILEAWGILKPSRA